MLKKILFANMLIVAVRCSFTTDKGISDQMKESLIKSGFEKFKESFEGYSDIEFQAQLKDPLSKVCEILKGDDNEINSNKRSDLYMEANKITVKSKMDLLVNGWIRKTNNQFTIELKRIILKLVNIDKAILVDYESLSFQNILKLNSAFNLSNNKVGFGKMSKDILFQIFLPTCPNQFIIYALQNAEIISQKEYFTETLDNIMPAWFGYQIENSIAKGDKFILDIKSPTRKISRICQKIASKLYYKGISPSEDDADINQENYFIYPKDEDAVELDPFADSEEDDDDDQLLNKGKLLSYPVDFKLEEVGFTQFNLTTLFSFLPLITVESENSDTQYKFWNNTLLEYYEVNDSLYILKNII